MPDTSRIHVVRCAVEAKAVPNPEAWKILQKIHQLEFVSGSSFVIKDAFVLEAPVDADFLEIAAFARQHDRIICGPVYLTDKKCALAVPQDAVDVGLGIWEWDTKALAEVTNEQREVTPSSIRDGK